MPWRSRHEVIMATPAVVAGVKDIRCSGVVVDCIPESSRYKLHLVLDQVPEPARASLQDLSSRC